MESPYKIRDLGIQVMVEPPDANDTTSLPQESIDDISNILGTIVRTSIDKTSTGGELTDEDIQSKIAVSVQPFKGKKQATEVAQTSIPWWIYAVGGGLLAVIILLIFFVMRARKKKQEEEVEEIIQPVTSVADINEEQQESEGTIRRKQLEKMAKEKPEEFAKLLRTWITED